MAAFCARHGYSGHTPAGVIAGRLLAETGVGSAVFRSRESP
jgi:hypothetical protein